MQIMENLFYTKEHEWVKFEDSIAIVGISDYAQSSLGDITFVELPQIDSSVEQTEQFASIESVKAASEVYSPVSGKVVDTNTELDADPGLMNSDCYEKGWIAKFEISEDVDKSQLMTADEYEGYVESLS